MVTALSRQLIWGTKIFSCPFADHPTNDGLAFSSWEQKTSALQVVCFFAVTYNGEIYSCDFSSAPKLIRVAKLPEDDYRMEWQCYIVECAGEILVVSKKYGFSDEVFYTTSFRVFKLDVKGKKAVEVKSIGDYALFLGMNDPACRPTTSNSKIFKRNCIYFTDDRHQQSFWGEIGGGEDMGVRWELHNSLPGCIQVILLHAYLGNTQPSLSIGHLK